MIKNILIAVAAVFVGWVGLQLLHASFLTPTIPLIFGASVFMAQQRLSANRQELLVDDATRQSCLSAVAPAGQALLYVYREGLLGKFLGWDVSVDGMALAQLRSPRFTQATLRPGPHTLAVRVGGPMATKIKPAETIVEAQPGETIVFVIKLEKSALSFGRVQDARTALQKLSKVPMVAANRAGTSASPGLGEDETENRASQL